MYHACKYRLTPSNATHEGLDRHRDLCGQVYNHSRYRLGEYREFHSETPSMTALQPELPDLKQR